MKQEGSKKLQSELKSNLNEVVRTMYKSKE